MAEEDKVVARRLYEEVFGSGDLELLDDIALDEYVEHNPLPGQGRGLRGLKDRVAALRDALAPRFTIEDVIAEGDKVVVRWTNSGSHVGEFAGIPPTNKDFTIGGIDIYRVEDGKLAEHWDVVDQLSLLQQLGLLPSPEDANA
jgi:predicted ester cyclase